MAVGNKRLAALPSVRSCGPHLYRHLRSPKRYGQRSDRQIEIRSSCPVQRRERTLEVMCDILSRDQNAITALRDAYVNQHAGFFLDLPPRLETIEARDDFPNDYRLLLVNQALLEEEQQNRSAAHELLEEVL